MPALEDVPPQLMPALTALTARLKHDLGKYIAFAARWLPEDAAADERLDALRADLLQTRRGPDGVQDAASVWQGYAAMLLGTEPLEGEHAVDLADDPDVAAIVTAMTDLGPVLASLRAETELTPDALAAALALTREVSARCRTLNRRAAERASSAVAAEEANPTHG